MSKLTGALAIAAALSVGALPASAGAIGWAVGNAGTIVHTGNGGSTWSPQTSGTGAFLFGVKFVDANNGWAVGAGGVIVHTGNGGSSWSPQTNGISGNVNLNAVSFVDANNGWAVGIGFGQAAPIVHTSNGGATWSPQTSGTSNNLLGVSFVDANNGWVAGGSGTILHTSNGGGAWFLQTSGTSNNLNGVSFVDANNGWVVGGSGTILHTSNGGSTWSSQTSGTSAILFGVSFVDPNSGWAVGQFGTILHTSNGGTTWSPQSSGTSNEFLGVSFVDANNGWAVSAFADILHTSNGGSTWSPQSSGTSATLQGVSFVKGPPSLSAVKAHVGTFTQGGTGEWDVPVSNDSGSFDTAGATTVSDTLPAGYTVNNFSTTDASWSCNGTGTQTAACTSALAVSDGGSFPPIKIIVNIPAASPTSVMNTAKAFGGGDTIHTNLATAATGSDTVSVIQVPASVMPTAGMAQSTVINSAFPTNLQATVQDAGHVGVPNVNVTFQAPSSGPSGTFGSPCSGIICLVATNALGVATAPTFTANGTSGSYAVTAMVASLPPANFALVNLPPPSLSIAKTHVGTFTQGGTGEWDVTVSDAPGTFHTTGTTTVSDTLPTGYTVHDFSTTSASWSCTSTLAVNGGSGFPPIMMTVSIPANSASRVMNTARAFGGGDTTHTNIATAATGSDTVPVTQVPASVTPTAGTPQSTPINTTFATNLQATVQDAGHVGVPNVNVTFQAPSSGPSGTFGSPCSGVICVVTTNALGVATAPTFTANGTLGSYTVTATVPALIPAIFALTNVVPPTFTKMIATPFGAGSINQGDTTTVAFTLANPNSISLTGLTFTDTLPNGLSIQDPNGLSNTCGGTVTAVPGTGTISLAGGTVGSSASCTISVNVTGVAQGDQTNPSVTLVSNEAPPTVSAPVTVFVYPWWLWFFY
jgi:photosystem II stability/assembly factor-like uncharacterized protein